MDVTFIHAKIRVPFKHIPKRIQKTQDILEVDRQHVNTSYFRTSTIAALEAMEVPIEFVEVRFNAARTKCLPSTC